MQKFTENHYYEPIFDFNNTADELYIQARNNYIENPDALHRLKEILTQEGKSEAAERVGYMEEREKEDTSLFSVAQMKVDFMDNCGGIDEVAISDSVFLTVTFEPRDNMVIVSLIQIQDDDETIYLTGASTIPFEKFKLMSRAGFDRFVGEILFYGMNELE